MAYIMERVRKGLWLKIEEERNGCYRVMKENNVPGSGTALWKDQRSQGPCGSLRYDGSGWWPTYKVHHPIYYYCAYFSIRAKASISHP